MATATRPAARRTRAAKIAETAAVVETPATPEVPAAPAPVAAPAKSFPKAAVAAKAPSDLHKNMAKWLEETTGAVVDLKTVQLVCSLRMEFQASEANQSDLAARRAKSAAKAEERVAKAQAAANKAVERAAKLAAAAKK